MLSYKSQYIVVVWIPSLVVCLLLCLIAVTQDCVHITHCAHSVASKWQCSLILGISSRGTTRSRQYGVLAFISILLLGKHYEKGKLSKRFGLLLIIARRWKQWWTDQTVWMILFRLLIWYIRCIISLAPNYNYIDYIYSNSFIFSCISFAKLLFINSPTAGWCWLRI